MMSGTNLALLAELLCLKKESITGTETAMPAEALVADPEEEMAEAGAEAEVGKCLLSLPKYLPKLKQEGKLK